MTDTSHIPGLVNAWKALGVSKGASRALALYPGASPDAEIELARAAWRGFSPASLWLRHDAPAPARSKYKTVGGDLADVARAHPEGFDLVLVGGGLEAGGPGLAADRMRRIAALAAPGGLVALTIDTFAAPLPGEAAGAWEALLFPELAQAEVLGEAAAGRTALPAAAWLGLIGAAGLEVQGVAGHGDRPPPEDLVAVHGARLAVFDAVELASGVIRVIARRRENAA